MFPCSLLQLSLCFLLIVANLNIIKAPRGKPISEYERERILHHLKNGKTIQDIEYWFGYSYKTIERLIIRYYIQGNTDYKQRRKPQDSKWKPYHTQRAIELLKENNALYLRELQVRLRASTGSQFSLSTIWKHLHKERISNKVLTRRFKEANPLVEIGFWTSLTRNRININQLIWYDESYICRLSGNRRRGWALKYVV